MKKNVLSIMILLAALLAVAASAAFAEETGFVLNASTEMRDVLAEHTGKKVALWLESGDEIEGTVTMVGNTLVQISKLTGKEFYDSIVSIDRISAVRVKMRDRQ